MLKNEPVISHRRCDSQPKCPRVFAVENALSVLLEAQPPILVYKLQRKYLLSYTKM